MASIMDPEKKVSIERLPESLSKLLPRYALPQFVRFVCEQLNVTGTYKFQKNKLRAENYNPNVCGVDDELYYYDIGKKTYVRLNDEVYEEIMKQKIRF